VDVIEFERWLNVGWLKQRAEMCRTTDASFRDSPTGRTASNVAFIVTRLLTFNRLAILKTRTQAQRELMAEQQAAEDWAARTLQIVAKVWFFKQQAKICLSIKLLEDMAMTKIQALSRGDLTRKKTTTLIQMVALKKRIDAIIRLQARARVAIARKERERLQKADDQLGREHALHDQKKVHSSTPNNVPSEPAPASFRAAPSLPPAAAEAQAVRHLREQMARMRERHQKQLKDLETKFFLDRMACDREHAQQLSKRAAADYDRQFESTQDASRCSTAERVETELLKSRDEVSRLRNELAYFARKQRKLEVQNARLQAALAAATSSGRSSQALATLAALSPPNSTSPLGSMAGVGAAVPISRRSRSSAGILISPNPSRAQGAYGRPASASGGARRPVPILGVKAGLEAMKVAPPAMSVIT